MVCVYCSITSVLPVFCFVSDLGFVAFGVLLLQCLCLELALCCFDVRTLTWFA